MNRSAGEFLCVYCWPASQKAALWDEQSLPCCKTCAEHPDRKAMCPSFVLKQVRMQRHCAPIDLDAAA